MTEKQDRYSRIIDAIEEERKNEEQYYRSLSAKKTNQQKVEKGILWYPVQIEKIQYTVGEYVEVEVTRKKGIDTPHKLKTGVGCILFYNGDERKEFKGVISFMRRNKLSIILNGEVFSKDQISEKGLIGIELVYDERPYKVMKQTIQSLVKNSTPEIASLREGIRKKEPLDYTDITPEEATYVPPHLNESQAAALRGVMSARQMGIIHGPPGTGKTTTLVALIKAILKTEKRILVCAPSNNATDLLARKSDEIGLNVLRVGNVTRIADSITQLTLAEKARGNPDWQHIKKVKIEAEEAKRIAGSYKRTFGHKEKAQRKDMYKESRELRKWAKDLEERLVQKIILEAQVICTTLIGVSSKMLKEVSFQTVIIDEASQALEPECWNAILKANRVILAGDHYQLPPTVKSAEALALGLGDTLLHRMSDHIKHSYLLNQQYRMNDLILSYSNKEFYGSKLFSHPSVANHTLDEDTHPLVFIDTSGCGFDEEYSEEHNSRYNSGEYFILREHVMQHMAIYAEASIGIISPYSQQVRYIRSEVEIDKNLQPLDITINTIDGFQGQEKDVIYISLVRSNATGEIGFLKDYRRINVAITRARKKLIILGDMSTLVQYPLFEKLADHIEKVGLYQSAWEYMST